MANPVAVGVDAINKSSFGCSASSLGYLIHTLQNFPSDGHPGIDAALLILAADCKKWQQGANFYPGSATFCLLTKEQLKAKAVLEANGFEELGRTISSHIWPTWGNRMNEFAQKLDAEEVIYLMGKGWFHIPKEQEIK